MQKVIAKYGLAAHLAILGVAPLFLLPFVGAGKVAVVLLWLSLMASVWVVLEPSVLRGEYLHDARMRVFRKISRDPLFWALAVAVLMAGVRALNTGIGLAYDAELANWHVSTALFPVLPGSVGTEGHLVFAAALSTLVLVEGCRHSLGRSARHAFLLLTSSLSGAAAVVLLLALAKGVPSALAFVSRGSEIHAFVGLVFGVYFLVGAAALVAVAENGWNSVLALPIFALGGNAAGAFSFSPVYQVVGAVGAFILMLAYVGFYSKGALSTVGKFKQTIIGMAAVAFAGLFVMVLLPANLLAERMANFTALALFPENYWEVRKVLSGIAFKSWIEHLWSGAGLGAFPLCFRFGAQPADWILLPRGAAAACNGWWQLLAERGVIGTLLLVLPVGFLLFTYVRRLWESVRGWMIPHPACLLAPLLVALLSASGFLDCSVLRVEVLMAAGSCLAISAAAFPRRKIEGHG